MNENQTLELIVILRQMAFDINRLADTKAQELELKKNEWE